jgi:hypothetical protein
MEILKMTKKTVFGLLIISLLFLGGCSKKSSDPNENEKAKAENAVLKAKIQQLEAINAEQQKKKQQVANSLPKAAVESNSAAPITKKEINKNTNEAVKKINKDANEVVRVSKPFFGIYLGEKIDELNKRFTLTPASVTKDEDDPKQNWDIRPDNPNIWNLSVDSFEGQVCSIKVAFKDASKENFDVLKTQLRQTYGEEQNLGFDGIVVGGERACFLPTIDGIQICIQCQYQEKLFDKKAICAIGYYHGPLLEKVNAEIKRRKLAKVKGDL